MLKYKTRKYLLSLLEMQGDYEVIIDLEDFAKVAASVPMKIIVNIWRQLFMIFKVLVRVR